MLKGKKIILGITGSIAAYKAAILIRLFVKEGAEVKVLMTPLAKEFITPLTLATLSKNPILVDFFNPESGDWNSHVDLGTWADIYLIAPASANTIAKMANGIADNLLLTTYLSARCPVFVVPAMDLDMLQHPATLKNINILKSIGNYIIEPQSGELASGLVGKGRMEEPETILQTISNFFSTKKKLQSKKILITAGPTYETIDPVRFIGNYSSGKMGYAIAKELANLGGQITLISGPTSLSLNHPNIKIINVTSANEMYNACTKNFKKADIAIMAAAVSDYTPKEQLNDKVKRKNKNLNLELTVTKDIAAELGKLKTSKQILIGFALETSNEEKNATGKIKKKNLDFIILNSLKDKGAGFQHETNKITIIDNKNNINKFTLKTKKEVAKDIITKLLEIL